MASLPRSVPPGDDAAKAADQGPSPISPRTDAAPRAIELSARAQRLLAAGELDGYRELFERDPRRSTTPTAATGPASAWSSRALSQAAMPRARALRRAVCGNRRRRGRSCSSDSRASPSCSTTPASPFTSCGASTPPEALFKAAKRLDPQLRAGGRQPGRARGATTNAAQRRSHSARAACARRAGKPCDSISQSAHDPPQACA